VPISVLIWVHSFIEPDFLTTMNHSTIPHWFIWSICSGN